MASIGYRARLQSSVVPRTVTYAPGIGAAIGKGMQQLGQVGMQVAEDNARIARGQTVADGMGRLSELQLSMEQRIQALRDGATGMAAGHATQSEEEVRKAGDDFMASLPNDPQVRQQFLPMVARWQAQAIGGERDWERSTRNTYIGQQFETSLSTQSAALYSRPTPDNLDAMLSDFDTAIGLQPVPDAAKDALRQKVRATLLPSLFEGALAQGQTDAVEHAVKSGQYDQWIGGAEGKSRWIERVGAARNIAMREAAAAAAARRDDARDGLDTIDARIDAGEAVPQADIESALHAAKAAGVEDARLIKFADAGTRSIYAAGARALTTQQLQQQVDSLDALRSSGKAKPDDIRALDAADKELDARADKGAADLAALWKDPAAQPLAVARLRAMAPSERARVAAKLDDKAMVLGSMTARDADVAMRGAGIRKDRPGAFMPAHPGKKDGDANLARKAFAAYVGLPLMNDLGPGYDALLDASLDLFVGYSANAGGSGTWNEAEFQKAINNVFGATRRRDGTIQGGLAQVRGRRVELPSGWTGPEFDKGLSRLSFAGAAYGDGSAARRDDVLANYRPVVVREEDDGTVWYRMEDARGRALTDGSNPGRAWMLRVPRTPGAR